jgi:hypothetical protein
MIKQLVAVSILLAVPDAVFAQGANCMWGANDVLCQSDRAMQQFQQESRGDRSFGPNDERIYNPDAGSFADDFVRERSAKFRNTFDARFANPRSLQYDPTRDPCMLDPGCDLTAKGIVHYRWLYQQCVAGSSAACDQLQAGAFTPAPSADAYPSAPRPPGY